MYPENFKVIEHPDIRYALQVLRNREQSMAGCNIAMRLAGAELYNGARFSEQLPQRYHVPILRAGLGLMCGVPTAITDCVETGFVDAKRDELTLQPEVKMYKCHPDLSHQHTIVFDVMVATGGSLDLAITLLKKRSHAQKISVISLICAPKGVALIGKNHPDVMIYAAVMDEGLDDNGYIVPGLGDAGDRMFGPIE